jgi:hypothetical protein
MNIMSMVHIFPRLSLNGSGLVENAECNEIFNDENNPVPSRNIMDNNINNDINNNHFLSHTICPGGDLSRLNISSTSSVSETDGIENIALEAFDEEDDDEYDDDLRQHELVNFDLS